MDISKNIKIKNIKKNKINSSDGSTLTIIISSFKTFNKIKLWFNLNNKDISRNNE